MVTLILSDIIGNPLDLIASAPTIPNWDSKEAAMVILKKYSIDGDIPRSIKTVLDNSGKVFHNESAEIGTVDGEFTHVRSFIIGRMKYLVL